MSFLFSFFCKIRQQEGGTGPAWGGGVDTSEKAEEVGKGQRRMNVMQILRAHEYKWKKDTC
jgi:hypothetical protein